MSSRLAAVAAPVVCLAFLFSNTTHAADGDWLANAFARKNPTVAFSIASLGPKEGRAKDRTRLVGDTLESEAQAKRKSLVGNHFAPASNGRWSWKVTKLKWATSDEEAYAEFLRRIGDSGCKTTHECLTSPAANPVYSAKNPPGMQFFADCADLPFILRAYFAWMNELPFSFSTALGLHPRTGPGKTGSPSFQVVGRYHIAPPSADPRHVLNEALRVSTSHFRVPANYKGRMLADHYPVDISRASVRAGTVIFDALGHVAIVYKVDDDGVVHYIDAHPDNSLTRGVFGSDIERSDPASGGGFLRWRPQTLVGARKGKNGSLHGGTLMLARNDQLPDWSDAQYYGTGRLRHSDWRKARFEVDGEEIDYYTYVRLRLAPNGYRFDPIMEVSRRVSTLCEELRQRVDAVDAAVRAGMPNRPQPARLPPNIYVTHGDWEAYATPSRDAQLKILFVRLREDVERLLAMHAATSRLINYSGADLRADLKQTYDNETSACTITYTRTDGSKRTLSFAEIKDRLFLMSFDPHHCVERRWGAVSPDELKTCPDGALKRAWYDAQQRLRNQTVRTIGDRMDFTLDDLRRQARESSDEVGEDDVPVIEVASLFGSH